MGSVVLTALESSVIGRVAYDPAAGLLYMEFKKNGDVWQYQNVASEEYLALLAAPSAGKRLAQIKAAHKGAKVLHDAWIAILADSVRSMGDAAEVLLYENNKKWIDRLREQTATPWF